MRVNWHIWNGVYRPAYRGPHTVPAAWGFPTLVVDANLLDWALPLSVHLGGPLLGKPGLTFRVLCLNIGWSRL